MNISTEHISQCNKSEPLADASGKIVDFMNENGYGAAQPDIGIVNNGMQIASIDFTILPLKSSSQSP